jgi:two-component system cell cycle response regulator
VQVAKHPSEHLILAVDDDRDNLTLIARTLEHEGYRVECVASGDEAIKRLKVTTPDLVLLDINMPGISGLETLKMLRMRDSYVSVIFVSARSETEDIIKGLDTGSDDYVCKPFDPMELLARVRAHLRIKDLTDRLAMANARLQALVDIDDLTGLFNMRSIYMKLDTEISRARRSNRACGVVMMDMDNFKLVNDGHDHLFGSFVLAEVGKLVQANIRGVDFAARYGGDEFLIALSDTTPEGANRFADRLRAVIEQHNFAKEGHSMRMTASLGVAVVRPTLQTVDAKSLIRYADHAMYEAKRNGRNCICSFDTPSQSIRKTS